jgi:hypothetical protein
MMMIQYVILIYECHCRMIMSNAFVACALQ